MIIKKLSIAKTPCFILIAVCILHSVVFGQIQRVEISGFTLSKNGSDDVVLHQSTANNWKVIGSTGRANIRALAIDSKNGKIYTVDGGNLGTLDSNTGKFTLIGEIGTGNGAEGRVKFDNIYGLAFDANRNILYASQRTNSYDLLLQINPKTAKVIANSMINSSGKTVDYKKIIIKTYYFGFNYESKQFADIAYDNSKKLLYIAHNYFHTSHGINAYSNIDTQAPKEVSKISPIQKLSGIAFSAEGKFYACFSDNKVTNGNPISGGGVTINIGELHIIDANASSKTLFTGLAFSNQSIMQAPTAPTCASAIQLNTSPTAAKTIMAGQTIQATAKIYVNTRLVAGNSVILNNNFEVYKFANFEILIDEGACK